MTAGVPDKVEKNPQKRPRHTLLRPLSGIRKNVNEQSSEHTQKHPADGLPCRESAQLRCDIYFSMRSYYGIYHGKINKCKVSYMDVFEFIFPSWKCWKNKYSPEKALAKIQKRPYMNIFSFTPLAYAPGREK